MLTYWERLLCFGGEGSGGVCRAGWGKGAGYVGGDDGGQLWAECGRNSGGATGGHNGRCSEQVGSIKWRQKAMETCLMGNTSSTETGSSIEPSYCRKKPQDRAASESLSANTWLKGTDPCRCHGAVSERSRQVRSCHSWCVRRHSSTCCSSFPRRRLCIGHSCGRSTSMLHKPWMGQDMC